jgi:hypothetical protein
MVEESGDESKVNPADDHGQLLDVDESLLPEGIMDTYGLTLIWSLS